MRWYLYSIGRRKDQDISLSISEVPDFVTGDDITSEAVIASMKKAVDNPLSVPI
jgi:hypothetical protein